MFVSLYLVLSFLIIVLCFPPHCVVYFFLRYLCQLCLLKATWLHRTSLSLLPPLGHESSSWQIKEGVGMVTQSIRAPSRLTQRECGCATREGARVTPSTTRTDRQTDKPPWHNTVDVVRQPDTLSLQSLSVVLSATLGHGGTWRQFGNTIFLTSNIAGTWPNGRFLDMAACMYCINCFFIDNVLRLLSYVNVCACHVYFTINLLTYLLVLISHVTLHASQVYQTIWL